MEGMERRHIFSFHWEQDSEGNWYCACCDEPVEPGEGCSSYENAPSWNYCPNCGQPMDGEPVFNRDFWAEEYIFV